MHRTESKHACTLQVVFLLSFDTQVVREALPLWAALLAELLRVFDLLLEVPSSVCCFFLNLSNTDTFDFGSGLENPQLYPENHRKLRTASRVGFMVFVNGPSYDS